jgi:3D (Asp-Asp-Asp) domain-containing protein
MTAECRGASRRSGLVPLVLLATACSTMGSHWVAEPLGAPPDGSRSSSLQPPPVSTHRPPPRAPRSHSIGAEDPHAAVREAQTLTPAMGLADGRGAGLSPDELAASGGRRLGKFRNTYYDFPVESDYEGRTVSLFDARCRAVAEVPEGFHDAVCVQGSGLLEDGRPVSFARRDCGCARVCPRTGQRICFEALNGYNYPWGRGATGRPIVPLLTVAVDSKVIPLGTSLYIPEYVGMPRDLEQTGTHDGCFIAQDRGLKVRGQHVDIFTGDTAMTDLWNRLLPSNKGVTVVLDSPRCERVAVD